METTVRRLSDTTWAFEQGMVRCFYIAGADRALLLDTGVAETNLFQLMMPLADLPLVVVNTHAHGDHTANNRLFPSVYAHRLEPMPEDGPVVRPLEEGHVFDLGGVRLEVLHTPGHTPGSICLLDRANRVLYSGDTVSHGPVYLCGPGCSSADYTASLRRLKDLSGDFDTVLCCHGDCPLDPSVIDELLALVAGAQDGTLSGEDPAQAFPFGNPKVYRLGQSTVFLEPGI